MHRNALLQGEPKNSGAPREIGKKIEKMIEFQAKFKFELDENANRKVINNLPGLLCPEEAWLHH
jgi:hypothetical protein